jgi:hypothetical protein
MLFRNYVLKDNYNFLKCIFTCTFIDKFNIFFKSSYCCLLIHILTEAVFHNKNKNNALFKLFQRRGFKSLNFTYIQPPTETLFPIIGNLLVKSYSRELNIDTIVKDIYFNHYASWYKGKFYYIYLIKCLYAIQKLCIKRQQ